MANLIQERHQRRCRERSWLLFLGLALAAISLHPGASFAGTGKLNTLQQQLDQTHREARRLNLQLQALTGDVRGITEALFIPLQITKSLAKIDDLLKLMQETLSPLQVLPQIGTIVGGVTRVLGVLQKGIHPIRQETSKVEKPILAVGNALMLFDQVVLKQRRAFAKALASISRYTKTTRALQRCARKGPGLQKHTLLFADASLTRLGLLHKTIKGTSTALGPLSSALRKSRSIVKALVPVQKTMVDLDRTLDKIKAVTLKLQHVLRQRIEVPYPVKVRQPFKIEVKDKVKVKVRVKIKQWYNPFSWKWVFKTKIKWKEIVKVKTKWKDVVQLKKFGFTVEQILKGAKTGVGSVNGKLKELAMKALAPLLQELKDKLPKIPTLASIPGLSSVGKSFRGVLQGTLAAPRLLKGMGTQLTGLGTHHKSLHQHWAKQPKCR